MGDLVELRSLYEGGQLDQAWALYREMDAAGEAGPEVHLLGAKAAQYRGDLFGARWAVERAVEGCPVGEVQGQVRFAQGYIYMMLGEVRGAVEQFRAFLADGQEYPATYGVAAGHAWYNLGLSLRQAKESVEALDCYLRACDMHRANNLRQSLREALQNVAWTACLLGRVEMAREALDEASGILESDTARWMQRLGEAFLSATTGDSKDALDQCQSILGDYTDAPTQARGHACWVAGRVALSLGMVEQAEDLAKRGVVFGSQISGDSRCLRDCADLLREVRSVLAEKQGA